MRLMEEAKITRIAIGTAFSGEQKPFDQLVEAYTPSGLREQSEAEKIKSSARKLQKLFGG